MSIQAVKGVEIGDGFDVARRPGSTVHDPIGCDAGATRAFTRPRIRPSRAAPRAA